MTTDQDKARAVIVQFLERAEKPHEGMTDATALYGEGLGLDSLETAELSAMLEDELGSDPFSDGELPDTVGGVLEFYKASSNA